MQNILNSSALTKGLVPMDPAMALYIDPHLKHHGVMEA